MNRKDRRPLSLPKRGYLMTELVVAAGVLITVMSLVASMTPRLGRLWQQTVRQRAATMELSNQLERLTLLSEPQLRKELEQLQPSAPAKSALPEPQLSGELVADPLGRRLVLRIDWQRRHPGPPVELVGWLTGRGETSDEPESASEPNPEPQAAEERS